MSVLLFVVRLYYLVQMKCYTGEHVTSVVEYSHNDMKLILAKLGRRTRLMRLLKSGGLEIVNIVKFIYKARLC